MFLMGTARIPWTSSADRGRNTAFSDSYGSPCTVNMKVINLLNYPGSQFSSFQKLLRQRKLKIRLILGIW